MRRKIHAIKFTDEEWLMVLGLTKEFKAKGCSDYIRQMIRQRWAEYHPGEKVVENMIDKESEFVK